MDDYRLRYGLASIIRYFWTIVKRTSVVTAIHDKRDVRAERAELEFGRGFHFWTRIERIRTD